MRLLGRARIFVALLGIVLFNAAPGTADTIATFADPSPGGANPLFQLSGDTLTAGWGLSGLELQVPIASKIYADATFVATDLTVTSTVGPLKILSGGTIDFFDTGGSKVLQLDFDSAALYIPFSFGASDLTSDNVTISGPGIPKGLTDEHFAFSFANQVKTADGYTWTAAFTSSAIPEPASVALLALGLLGLRRR